MLSVLSACEVIGWKKLYLGYYDPFPISSKFLFALRQFVALFFCGLFHLGFFVALFLCELSWLVNSGFHYKASYLINIPSVLSSGRNCLLAFNDFSSLCCKFSFSELILLLARPT